MKSTPRSRRHRNPHVNEEQQQQTPFFSKANDTPVQKKERPFFSAGQNAVQTKLAIGQPGDKYEQEADAVADAVVNKPAAAPGVQQKGKGIQRDTLATPEKDEKLSTAEGRMEEDKTIQEKPKEEEPVQAKAAEEEEPVQMQAAEEEEPVQAKAEEEEPVQMQAAEEEEPVQAKAEEEEPVQKQAAEEEEPVQAKAEEEEPVQMQAAEEEEPVQAKAEEEEPVQMQAAEEEEPVQAKAEEEEPVQAKSEGGGKAAAPLATRLKSSKGKGRPLSGKARQEMESSIGANFEDVNIHSDKEAIGMNEELRAQAFTYGRDIYFNEGKYNPDSAEGKRLLAHELTHVVQQGEAKGKPELQKDNQPWPFNGRVINNSGSDVTVWSDAGGCYVIAAGASSARFGEDVDFIRSQSGTWYKIGANTVTVHASGGITGYSRPATASELGFLSC